MGGPDLLIDANKGVRVWKVEGRDNWTKEDAAKAE